MLDECNKKNGEECSEIERMEKENTVKRGFLADVESSKGGRGRLRGKFWKEDWKVIATMHVVETRPGEIEKERRGTECEINTGKIWN